MLLCMALLTATTKYSFWTLPKTHDENYMLFSDDGRMFITNKMSKYHKTSITLIELVGEPRNLKMTPLQRQFEMIASVFSVPLSSVSSQYMQMLLPMWNNVHSMIWIPFCNLTLYFMLNLYIIMQYVAIQNTLINIQNAKFKPKDFWLFRKKESFVTETLHLTLHIETFLSFHYKMKCDPSYLIRHKSQINSIPAKERTMVYNFFYFYEWW